MKFCPACYCRLVYCRSCKTYHCQCSWSLKLKGAMCHNAECVFCRRTMDEVGDYLDALLIAPVVDGERIFLPVNAVAPSDTEQRLTPDVAVKLLAVRDALADEDYIKAYHHLYLIADPRVESLTPWAKLEEIAARAALQPKAEQEQEK